MHKQNSLLNVDSWVKHEWFYIQTDILSLYKFSFKWNCECFYIPVLLCIIAVFITGFFFLYNTDMRNEKTPKPIHLFETRKTLIAYGFGV